MSRKKKKGEREWRPFQDAIPIVKTEAQALADDIDRPARVVKNNLYQVMIYHDAADPGWPKMTHLSIRRLDRGVVRDWRDLQRIKNELVGASNEAVELFPAEERLVDTANQFHLFVLDDPTVRFPFGFRERAVMEGNACGSVQRPFNAADRPADCTAPTTEEILEKLKERRR